MKILPSLLLLASLSLFPACASTVAIGSRITSGNPEGELYPATRMNFYLMGGLWDAGSWAIAGIPFVCVDVPFSCLSDTLILPYDIQCAREKHNVRR